MKRRPYSGAPVFVKCDGWQRDPSQCTDWYKGSCGPNPAVWEKQDSRSLILLSHAWTPPREIQLSSPYFPWYLIYSISSLSLERNLIFCFPYPFFGSGWQENQIFSFQPYPFGGLGWGQKCGNRLNYGCRQCRRRVWALSPMKSLWLRCQQTEAALLWFLLYHITMT